MELFSSPKLILGLKDSDFVKTSEIKVHTELNPKSFFLSLLAYWLGLS